MLTMLFFLFLLLFIPMLPIQQGGGHLDYGIYAYLQIPFIVIVVIGFYWWLCKKKSKAYRYLIFIYIVTTAMTNILGDRYLRVDYHEGLPIRNRLADYRKYPWANRPTKSQILADLGQPLASAIRSTMNDNIPQVVSALVGSEVLVYEETAPDGRHFTYYLVIDPETGLLLYSEEILGMLREDEWPKQPLR